MARPKVPVPIAEGVAREPNDAPVVVAPSDSKLLEESAARLEERTRVLADFFNGQVIENVDDSAS
jgi:hypothetical protein